MFCQNCGNEISEGSRFCANCGASAPLGEPDSQVQEAPVSEPAPDCAQPAYDTGAYYAQPKETVKKALTRWPSSLGVLSVFYLAFYLASVVFLILYYQDVAMPLGEIFGGVRIISLLLAIAVPVLFFVHTRKLAFLTAIPVVIGVILEGLSLISISQYVMDPMGMLSNLLNFFPGLILAVLYVVQMSARPHNPALSIIYLIFAVLSFLISAVSFIVTAVDGHMPGYLLLSNGLSLVALIFLTIAYCMAMFVSRKK